MATGRPSGPPRPGLLLALLAAGALFVYWTQIAPRNAQPADAATAVHDQTRDTRPHRSWGAAIGFVDQRHLAEHYEKHGAEFGHISKQDYLHQAQLLRDAQADGPVLETIRRNGVATRFDRDTGAFIAFNPDGTIRTFFKPNDGERYYRRQADRSSE